jgi:ABC-type polysaccharide/polyol phosphate transport system ATPase subunit
VEGVAKCFHFYANPWHRALDWLPLQEKRRSTEIWALQDISFTVPRGRGLGVIGRNGSGNSTLLKILTCVLKPTRGRVQSSGRILALLELGAGFNAEMTGRQNVLASCHLLGFPAEYAESRMADIQSFAEIGEYFDRPIKTYSAGMFVRLAFSIYLFFDPDILIVDEVLAVGDLFFQQKCARAVRAILDRGTTLFYVSHDMSSVQNFCDDAILLDGGRVTARGRPEEVIAAYTQHSSWTARKGREIVADVLAPIIEDESAVRAQEAAAHALAEEINAGNLLNWKTRIGTGRARLLAVRAINDDGLPSVSAPIGGHLTVQALVEADEPIDEPAFSVAIYDRFHNNLCSIGTPNQAIRLAPLRPGERVIYSVRLQLTISPGEYSWAVAIGETMPDDPHCGVFHDNHLDLGPLLVCWTEERMPFFGMFGLNAYFREEHRLGLPTSSGRSVGLRDPIAAPTL